MSFHVKQWMGYQSNMQIEIAIGSISLAGAALALKADSFPVDNTDRYFDLQALLNFSDLTILINRNDVLYEF